MIKSGFRQLHFSNGNIGNICHRKASKNSTLFKNNKMVFSILFSREQQSFYSKLQKNQKKETGGSYRKLKIKKMAIYKISFIKSKT